MVTLKQIEAMHWVEKLGSFHAAADQLHTTQSTISKRIKELEQSLGFVVFDRASSPAQVTLKGRELLGDFGQMLVLRQQIMHKASGAESYSGEFRLGVTEMVALTWLPQLIRAITETFPNIRLTTTVELTHTMIDKLAAHRLDLALCPGGNLPATADFPSLKLSALESAWMAGPTLATAHRGVLSVEELMQMPLLTFAEGSLLHQSVMRALTDRGVAPRQTITCSSMIALAELVREGLGVAFLPRDYFQSYARSGEMVILPTGFTLPPLEYAAVYSDNFIAAQIAELAQRHCRFVRPRER